MNEGKLRKKDQNQVGTTVEVECANGVSCWRARSDKSDVKLLCHRRCVLKLPKVVFR